MKYGESGRAATMSIAYDAGLQILIQDGSALNAVLTISTFMALHHKGQFDMTADELRAKFENWWLRNGDPFDLHKAAAWGAWQAAYASRDAEVEALRKDAERYQWLRSRCTDELCVRKGIAQITGAALNYAIDVAMREDRK